MTTGDRFSVVVCGSGVAGLEAVLRLRRLGGDRLAVTLVSPATQYVHRATAVLMPFSTHRPKTVEIQSIVDDLGVTWLRDELVSVDADGGTIRTKLDTQVPFDALLVAVGAHRTAPPDGAIAFTDKNAEDLKALFRRVFVGQTKGVLFAEPPGPTWPLPIYELALQTARLSAGNGHRADVHVSVAGPRPLDAFGVEAGLAVSDLLARAGITLHTNSTIETVDVDRTTFYPSGAIDVERVVTIPRLTGPRIIGLPCDVDSGFLQIDGQSRVLDSSGSMVGDGRIFAAGDATNLSVKHGGIGSQQADTAATQIAWLAGLGEPARPLHPVAEGVLATGGESLYLRAQMVGGRGWHCTVGSPAVTTDDGKIFAAELGPYLSRR